MILILIASGEMYAGSADYRRLLVFLCGVDIFRALSTSARNDEAG